MQRRSFLALTSTGIMACVNQTGQSCGQEKTRPADFPAPKERMRLGTQRGPLTVEWLQFFARHGVEGICGKPRINQDRRWRLEEILRMRELCETHGLRLELLGGILTSSGIQNQTFPHILLGRDPERDHEIDLFCEMIRVAARAEVPCIKYNLAVLPVERTRPTPGRGGSTYSTWNFQQTPKDPSLTPAGELRGDLFWERISYFLKRMIPVATEYRVRMACHPHDPGMPSAGYRGVDRVLGTVAGLKRFLDLSDSPYHGLNLCVGTIAEMLDDPRQQINDSIRDLASSGRVFNVHFRNIRGRRHHFQEVYPDEGDLDLYGVMLVLKEIAYPYLIMPDHMPKHPRDLGGKQAFAYGFGYIKGLLQAVNS